MVPLVFTGGVGFLQDHSNTGAAPTEAAFAYFALDFNKGRKFPPERLLEFKETRLMFDFDVVTGPSSFQPAPKPASQPPDGRAASATADTASEAPPASTEGVVLASNLNGGNDASR